MLVSIGNQQIDCVKIASGFDPTRVVVEGAFDSLPVAIHNEFCEQLCDQYYFSVATLQEYRRYFDGRDQSTRDGGNIYRRTFKGENAGKDFYKSLLGDLETLAKQKQAEGGGIIDLANYSGVQKAPQNISPEQLRALAANVNF